MYTYQCGDLQWPGGATIGYNGGPVGGFYQNHPLSGTFANSIACVNTGVTEWSNVIYNVSIDTYIPTGQPPTNESGKLPFSSFVCVQVTPESKSLGYLWHLKSKNAALNLDFFFNRGF